MRKLFIPGIVANGVLWLVGLALQIGGWVNEVVAIILLILAALWSGLSIGWWLGNRKINSGIGVSASSQPIFVWLSEKVSVENNFLIIAANIRINTLKLITINSVALELNNQSFTWDEQDSWIVEEPQTFEGITFKLPLNIPRGKQLAKLKSIVDGNECYFGKFMVDLPRSLI